MNERAERAAEGAWCHQELLDQAAIAGQLHRAELIAEEATPASERRAALFEQLTGAQLVLDLACSIAPVE